MMLEIRPLEEVAVAETVKVIAHIEMVQTPKVRETRRYRLENAMTIQIRVPMMSRMESTEEECCTSQPLYETRKIQWQIKLGDFSLSVRKLCKIQRMET